MAVDVEKLCQWGKCDKEAALLAGQDEYMVGTRTEGEVNIQSMNTLSKLVEEVSVRADVQQSKVISLLKNVGLTALDDRKATLRRLLFVLDQTRKTGAVPEDAGTESGLSVVTLPSGSAVEGAPLGSTMRECSDCEESKPEGLMWEKNGVQTFACTECRTSCAGCKAATIIDHGQIDEEETGSPFYCNMCWKAYTSWQDNNSTWRSSDGGAPKTPPAAKSAGASGGSGVSKASLLLKKLGTLTEVAAVKKVHEAVAEAVEDMDWETVQELSAALEKAPALVDDDDWADGIAAKKQAGKRKKGRGKCRARVRFKYGVNGDYESGEDDSSSDEEMEEFRAKSQSEFRKQSAHIGAKNQFGLYNLDKVADSAFAMLPKRVFQRIGKGEISISMAQLLAESSGCKVKRAHYENVWVGRDAWLEGWHRLAHCLHSAFDVPTYVLEQYRSRMVGFFNDYSVSKPNGAEIYDALYRARAEQAYQAGAAIADFGFSNRIYQRVFGAVQAATCTICKASTHIASGCPEIRRGSAGRKQDDEEVGGAGAGHTGRGNQGDGGGGSGGGGKSKKKGGKVCFGFNKPEGCTHGSGCTFKHVCQLCGSESHSKMNCPTR